MLEIKGITNVIAESISFDFYVPISMKFEPIEIRKEHHYYWRTGRFLEIGINPTSGAISSFTLLNVSKVYFHKKISQDIEPIKKNGLPLLNISKWPNNTYYIDNPKKDDFEVYVEKNSIQILLEPNNEIILHVINGRVIFGFDKNKHLTSIEVININAEEMKEFKEAHAIIKLKNIHN